MNSERGEISGIYLLICSGELTNFPKIWNLISCLQFTEVSILFPNEIKQRSLCCFEPSFQKCRILICSGSFLSAFVMHSVLSTKSYQLFLTERKIYIYIYIYNNKHTIFMYICVYIYVFVCVYVST